MAKCKAFISNPTTHGNTTSTAQAPTPPASNKTAEKTRAIIAEHRKYLREQARANMDDLILSQAKKRRTAPKKKVHSKVSGGQVDGGMLWNVVKRRHVTAEIPAAESANSNSSAVPATAQDARCQAVSNNKRKTRPQDSTDVENDSATPKKHNRASPQNAKNADALKVSRKSGKPNAQPNETVQPPSALLTPTLNAKVRQIHRFLSTTPDTASCLHRHLSNRNLISIPSRTLHGALVRMRADYALGDTYSAQVEDVENSVVERFEREVRQTPEQEWVTIDIKILTSFERHIHDQLSGHGLDKVKLLETELEMQACGFYSYQLPPVSDPLEFQLQWDLKLRDVQILEEEGRVPSTQQGTSAEKAITGKCVSPPQMTQPVYQPEQHPREASVFAETGVSKDGEIEAIATMGDAAHSGRYKFGGPRQEVRWGSTRMEWYRLHLLRDW